MSETVALNKKRQSKFAKKSAKLKNKLQKGEIKIEEDVKPKFKRKFNPRGLIYLGHIPHGFYEDEMREYFKQFGEVTNVRVCRSFKTGKSKGYGFVEFLIPEVAEVAAETMHNYLMFNRRLESKYIPPEKQNPDIFKGDAWMEKNTPYKSTNKLATKKRNMNFSPKKHILKAKLQMAKLNKTANKLKALGISHTVRPVDIPEEIDFPVDEQLKETKKSTTKKVVKKSVKTKKTSSGKMNDFISETELDTSVDDSPKKKRVVKKKSNLVMKKMSDKLKMATMSVLDSDLVVKKKGKIEKKVIKKKK